MTNREKYKEELCDIAIARKHLAVSNKSLKPCMCNLISCFDCIANNNITSCEEVIREWADSKYVEPCPFEKDELVEVSNDGKNWKLRYFSCKKNGCFYCYREGLTSKDALEVWDWKYYQKYGTLGGLVKEQKE